MPQVVVIDDDAELLTLLVEILNRSGYDAAGLNGIASIHSLVDLQPALVLLDMKMPLLSGEEVLRLMRESADLCSVPVIIITALPQLVNSNTREMAQGLLGKPCSIDLLLQTISKFFNKEGAVVCESIQDML